MADLRLWKDEILVKRASPVELFEVYDRRSGALIRAVRAAKPEAVVPILEFLKVEAGFDYLVDVTAVDRLDRAERFELVYILYSFSRNQRIRIKTSVAEGSQPATASGVHPTANWLEREVFDMFGIEFDGHPDMRRILLPEEWQGYPLRKDYPILQQDQAWVRENLGIDSAQ